MENFLPTLSLFMGGLVIGLFISIAAAATINGLCEAIVPGSGQRRLGLILLMIYVPGFLFLMRNMTEVTPMIIGVTVSSTIISIAVFVKNMFTTKQQLQSISKGD